MIDVDLSGVFYCLRYEIVNISSVLGTNGCPQQVAYAAAKHGIVGLTKCAALEYADHGIRAAR